MTDIIPDPVTTGFTTTETSPLTTGTVTSGTSETYTTNGEVTGDEGILMDDSSSAQISAGGIAGIVIGIIAFIAIVAIIAIYLIRRKSRRNNESLDNISM